MPAEGRDFSDNDILQSTIREEKDGKIRFKTVLPSGRDLVSEYMNADAATGKVMISWCENVRAQVDVDVAEAQATKKRETLEEAPTTDLLPGDTLPESTEVDVSEDPNPIDFAIRQRDAYEQRVHILEERITQQKIERKLMRGHYEQWEKVVATLRGETDE